jgi:uncharacterized protein
MKIIYLKWVLVCLLCAGCCGPGPKPIHRAAWSGNRAEMAKLVSLGADIDARFSPECHKGTITLFEDFAGRGDMNMVEFLIALGADPTGGANAYRTPLHVAAEKGKTNTINELLAHGVNVDLRNSEGSTPLMWAAWHSQPEAFNLLIHRGADIKARDRRNQTVLSFDWYSYRNPVSVFYPGDQPFSYQNLRTNVRALLDHGAEVNVTNKMGRTPLMNAVVHAKDLELVKILLEAGANPAVTNKHGESALWLAQWLKNEPMQQVIQDYQNRR